MEDTPFYSIIILLRDFPHLMSLTLDTIRAQNFSSYEIIIVEYNTDPSVLEGIERQSDKLSHIYTVNQDDKAHMMNHGMELAKGQYLHFLISGDTYLSHYALQDIKALIEKSDHPDMLYCGYLLRETNMSPKAIIHPFTSKHLQKGELPSRLQACFFSKKSLIEMKGFSEKFKLRSGLDLICRIFLKKDRNVVFSKRVYTDFEYRKKSPKEVMRYALETFYVILVHFGIVKAFSWWFIQDRLRLIKWSIRSLKKAFWRA